MASFSFRSTLTPPSLLSPKPRPKTLTSTSTSFTTVRCGSRSNRGPLMKGRILSTEAILAVQSLKRAYRTSSSPSKTNLPNLSRLLKSDLVAVLRELLRQDLCNLALHVFSTLRSEYPDQIDLNLYGHAIFALLRNKMLDEIDCLIVDLEKAEGKVDWESDKGAVRVVKGVVEAGRKESTVRICEMMRRSGCGETWTADEYVVNFLSKGLRSMGEVELATEIEMEFGRVFSGNNNMEKLVV